MEVHTQLRNVLRNIERKRSIRNHPLIHAILIIIVMNITVGNQIHASDVDWRIISSQIFRNRTLQIRKLTGTRKTLKLVHTDQRKQIKR